MTTQVSQENTQNSVARSSLSARKLSKLRRKYGDWALVTGASAGIGAAISKQLAEQGFNIVAVARNAHRLDALAAKLRLQYQVQVRTIAQDMSQEGAASALNEASADLDIGMVVPNAGTENSGNFVDGDLDSHRQLIALNTIAPMEVAHIFGRRLAARGRGGILFVSSTFGYQAIPLLANYAASKAYILSLGEALHVELKPRGVDVTVLAPGVTRTEMPQAMPFDFSKLPVISQSPEEVASTGLKALGLKATVISGWLSAVMTWSNRFIPRAWPVSLFGFLLQRAVKPGSALLQPKKSPLTQSHAPSSARVAEG